MTEMPKEIWQPIEAVPLNKRILIRRSEFFIAERVETEDGELLWLTRDADNEECLTYECDEVKWKELELDDLVITTTAPVSEDRVEALHALSVLYKAAYQEKTTITAIDRAYKDVRFFITSRAPNPPAAPSDEELAAIRNAMKADAGEVGGC